MFGRKIKYGHLLMESMRKIINSKNKSLYQETKHLLLHWGFGESCSSIYALLFISEKPLTAEEVAEELGYAYSSMINELNKLRREGIVTRERKDNKYVYISYKMIDSILLKEKEKTLSILNRMNEILNKEESTTDRSAMESVQKSIDIIERGKNNVRKTEKE